MGNYHEDLVLLGGLVPLLICRHPETEDFLPRPATLDVDLGVSLGASAGQYGTMSSDLRAHGFHPSTEYPGRFEKEDKGIKLYVDFLVEHGTAPQGTRMVDDVPASVLPGVVRALESARIVPLEGIDFFGARQNIRARVCEVGPFLVLKLRAFLNRQQPKDAFDILYTVKYYDKGPDDAIAAFANEADLDNPAFPDALQALQALFSGESDPGPVKASHFVLGQQQSGESSQVREHRILIRQDMVDIAQALLRACGPGRS
ncbi:MAG: hypothetical protein ACP5I4_10440 [Oceanipulchritudo sp.]